MGKRRGRGEGHVEQLPSKNWRAVVSRTVNGERTRSSRTFRTHAEAVEWKNRQRGPAAGGTLGEWVDTWLELQKAAVAASGWESDRQLCDRHLKPGLGSVRLRDLTALSINRWLARLREEGRPEQTRHALGKLLRKVLYAAVRNELLPANPMTGKVKIPRQPPPRSHALGAADLRKVVAAADALGHGTVFRLWADAGPRPAELTGFQVGDFDPKTGSIKVCRAVCKVTHELKEPKTRRGRRTIPLAPSTVSSLLSYLATRPGALPTDPLFPAPKGGHWVAQSLRRDVIGPVRKAAGVRFTGYTLRHTMASLLLQSGVSLKVVSERLGHEDVATTLRSYAHVLPGMQEAAALRMESILNPPHDGPTAGA